jgi:hypothetical protein
MILSPSFGYSVGVCTKAFGISAVMMSLSSFAAITPVRRIASVLTVGLAASSLPM